MNFFQKYEGAGVSGSRLVIEPVSQQEKTFLEDMFLDLRVNEAGQSPVVVIQRETIAGRPVYVVRQAFTDIELPPPARVPHGDGKIISESQEGILSVKQGSIDLSRLSPDLQSWISRFMSDNGDVTGWDIIFNGSRMDTDEGYSVKANNLLELNGIFTGKFLNQSIYKDIELNGIEEIVSSFHYLLMNDTVKSFTANNLQTISGSSNFYSTNIESLSLPALQTISGSSNFYSTNIESLSLPALQTISGSGNFKNATIESLSLPALQTISGSSNFQNATIETLSLPALQTISGSSNFQNATIETLSLPALQTISGSNNFELYPAKEISLPLVAEITGHYNFMYAEIETLTLPALKKLSGVQNFYSTPNLKKIATNTIRIGVGSGNGYNCPMLDTIEFLGDIAHPPINDSRNQITTIIIREGAVANIISLSHDWRSFTSLSQESIADLFANLADNTNGQPVTFRFDDDIYNAIPQEVKDLASGKNYNVTN